MSNEANAEPDKLRYFTGREAEVDCRASHETSNSDLPPITFLIEHTGGKNIFKNCTSTTKNVISERLVVALAFSSAYQSSGRIMPGLMTDLQFTPTLIL